MSVSDVQAFAAKLRSLQAEAIAKATATSAQAVLTASLQADFSAGRIPGGGSRPSGAKGFASLVDTGALRGGLRFVQSAEGLRVALNVPYAKYVQARFSILPATLPAQWAQVLVTSAQATVERAMQ